MSTPFLEREVKLRFTSADEARAAVRALGATPLLGRRLQEDALLDTPEGRLRDRQTVLRLRTESGKSRVTFKGPVQPSVMKVREELETVVGDGEVLLRILEELGLRIWFQYEKYREEFSREDVIIAECRNRDAGFPGRVARRTGTVHNDDQTLARGSPASARWRSVRATARGSRQ